MVQPLLFDIPQYYTCDAASHDVFLRISHGWPSKVRRTLRHYVCAASLPRSHVSLGNARRVSGKVAFQHAAKRQWQLSSQINLLRSFIYNMSNAINVDEISEDDEQLCKRVSELVQFSLGCCCPTSLAYKCSARAKYESRSLQRRCRFS